MALKMSKKKVNKPRVVKKTAPMQTTAKASVATNVGGESFQAPSSKYVEAVGRRKVATARVRVYPKEKAGFVVNQIPAEKYFSNVANFERILHRPFQVVGLKLEMLVVAEVQGSGISAQLDAVVHGLARALILHNPDWRKLIKPEGLLTRDDRMKETRKIGTGGKARRKRQSPKR